MKKQFICSVDEITEHSRLDIKEIIKKKGKKYVRGKGAESRNIQIYPSKNGAYVDRYNKRYIPIDNGYRLLHSMIKAYIGKRVEQAKDIFIEVSGLKKELTKMASNFEIFKTQNGL